MTTQPSTASVRETLDALRQRLARIEAAASSLDAIAAEIHRGVPPADLLAVLQQIQLDLARAAYDAEVAHARATLELDSIEER